jgi:hypothetical protein
MRVVTLFLCLAFFVSACSAPASQGVLSQIDAPPDPEQGTATVVGQVLEMDTNKPLGDVIVRLAEVHREGEGGVYVLNMASSPGTRTDANGYYVMESIPAGEYVLAVGETDNINLYYVIKEGNSERAKVWQAVSDQVSDWGVVEAKVLFR